jgi:hypothetical protein
LDMNDNMISRLLATYSLVSYKMSLKGELVSHTR